MQVWDILRAIEWAAREEKISGSAISLYGKGEMGILALYAALFDDRVKEVILNDPPGSHWQGPALLNVLRVTDIPEVAGAFAPGDHGATFGGNPVSCAAACAVMDTVDDALLANVREQGARLRAGLAGLPSVTDVRGAGLLIGADTERAASEIVAAALERGLVVLTAGEHVLRLVPPLVVGTEEVDQALTILKEVIA